MTTPTDQDRARARDIFRQINGALDGGEQLRLITFALAAAREDGRIEMRRELLPHWHDDAPETKHDK